MVDFRKFMKPEEDRIRPEVRALADRGNITLEEWQTFRGNSWELELIATKLNDEAFLYYAEHMLKNCQCETKRPFRSYNEAVMLFVAPDLVRRLRDALISSMTLPQYINWLNEQAKARRRDNPNLWGGLLTEDLDHWKGKGITTAAQLGAYLNECCEHNK